MEKEISVGKIKMDPSRKRPLFRVIKTVEELTDETLYVVAPVATIEPSRVQGCLERNGYRWATPEQHEAYLSSLSETARKKAERKVRMFYGSWPVGALFLVTKAAA